ncbi:LysR family transcriptional regulator [Acetanaerobacterium elongatum]|uniref:Transcriptional regulator, LysR family n=1 Tax=Acetanaerobacterium elongatum TaxID=258515 RepID=A0A1G9W871_9FIRM|nr:LysR family transcriptional regulator [Acetanaerobacterium elongatum]SDM80477.1 transcriptional regulator, LysR family [Acetanaerobacterium elongatum]
MELKNLNTFLVLSKTKNFTKTAQYLGYVQSSITAQIQQLEKELNVQLFERMGKNVSLTAEGERLIPYAQKMLALSSDIKSLYAGAQCRGKLVVGASESISIYRLPPIISRFKEAYPNIDLYLHLLNVSDFAPLLINNTFDVAFVLDKPIINSGIKTALEIEERICVLSSPDCPLAKKAAVDIQDFAGLPVIFTGRGCSYRGMFEHDLAEHGVVPNIVLETSSIQVIKEAAMSGLGLCILPELAVMKELGEKKLIKLAYTNNYNISSQLIYHKDKWLSPAMEGFISIAKQYA